jgi:threonine synthase
MMMETYRLFRQWNTGIHQENAIREGIPALKPPSLYDVLAQSIARKQVEKRRPIWILIEAYHGGGKTHMANCLKERLSANGFEPVIVGLDISWTDRCDRVRWRQEAYRAHRMGQDHNYFNALGQEPPMHWRKWHADEAISILGETAELALRTGQSHKATVKDCYQFNEVGDTTGVSAYDISPRSVILVEGVYASMLDKDDWDLRIYILADQEHAKCRAMARDEWKVHRPQNQTRELYEDVYEPTYREYLSTCRPIGQADIIIDATEVDEQRMPRHARLAKASPHVILLLECCNPGCRHQSPPARISSCRECGGDLRNVIVGDVDFLETIDEAYASMWRYHRLMAVDPDCIVGDKVGSTPVVYLPNVSKALGIHLWLKLEIANPTGTFKDREGAYVVTVSRQEGQENVVMQSTGNTAVAITHYAGLARMPSWVFIPKSNIGGLLMPPRNSMNHIIAVDGHPLDVKCLAEDFAVCYGFPKISPFHERCEANVTQAYEIAEAVLTGTLPAQELLERRGFDYYVQTIAAGMGPIGFYVGMKRLQEWTRGILRVPRILAVEIAEFAPMQAAWDAGLERLGETATPHFPDHELFAPTLWTTNAAKYYPHLREMLLATNGILTAVSPEQVRAATQELGVREELAEMGYQLADCEKCSFVGFAGLVEKIKSGEVEQGSRVILMLTGKGYHNTFVRECPDFVADPNQHKPRDILAAITPNDVLSH